MAQDQKPNPPNKPNAPNPPNTPNPPNAPNPKPALLLALAVAVSSAWLAAAPAITVACPWVYGPVGWFAWLFR